MPYRPSQTIDSVGERSGTTAMPSKHDRRHSRWRLDPEGEGVPRHTDGSSLWSLRARPVGCPNVAWFAGLTSPI